ncbi:MAG TPA: (d)CMP kinase [Candidatus Saccharimonadia bacterium]|nr:(d)CMP kinase [Candidatus Saccharimonadia bacterium]
MSQGQGILAIQGDSGIGKTTLGRDVARALEVPMYETSNGFRGFTAWALHRGVDCSDEVALAKLAEEFQFAVIDDRVVVCGLDVTDDLRSAGTEQWVSPVAHVHAVRQAFVRAMHDWVNQRPAVAVGRHLREIWPDAQLVIQVERHDEVTRRAAQSQGSHAAPTGLLARSELDRKTGQRVLAHLTGKHFEELDTTGMDKIQQAAAALELARRYGF